MGDSSVATADKVQAGLTTGVLASALFLGGGQGWLGDTLAQLLAVLLLACVIAGSAANRQRLQALPLRIWLPLGVLLVPLVQMLPMPLSAWAGIEGRSDLVSQLASVGLSPDPHVALQTLGPERAL